MNSKLKLLKGYELFDNEGYKKCVDDFKKSQVDISSSKISELSQAYLKKEIDPRMIERLYKGELKQLRSERIDALQRVFEELKSLPKNSVVFRKNHSTTVARSNSLLNDIQTRNLISLHLNSAAHLMYLVTENIVNSPAEFDRASFHGIVKSFLSESRMLCDVFESQKLGNIYDFLQENFDDLVSSFTEEALDEILNSDKQDAVKKEQMLGFIRKKQSEFQRLVDQALNSHN